jgi:hypothetical protein
MHFKENKFEAKMFHYLKEKSVWIHRSIDSQLRTQHPQDPSSKYTTS